MASRAAKTFSEGPFGKPVAELTKLGAEFFGSFLVVFVVCSNLSGSKHFVTDSDNSTAADISSAAASSKSLAVFAPTSIACVYMAMHYALKNVSGGILNPAVTIALVLQRTLGKIEGLKVVAAQSAGGAAAGFATLFLYGWEPEANIVGPRTAGFLIGAPLVEALYTCLVFVYLNVNRDVLKKKQKPDELPPSDKNYFALAVGFVYIAGGVGGSYVSGGAYNPAVSLGINFMGPNWHVITLPIYIAAQAVGAIVAVLLFYIVRKEWYVSGEDDQAMTRAATTQSEMEKKADEAVARGLEKVTSMFDAEDTCEFIGTMFLSLTISLNQIDFQDAMYHPKSEEAEAAAGKVWSLAACIISLMYAMSDCSGGLFNPSITLAYAVRFYNTRQGLNDHGRCEDMEGRPWGRISDPAVNPKETAKYFIFQLLGGAAGTGLTILVWLASGTWPVAAIKPGEGYSDWQAMFAEFYGTFLICYAMVVVMLSTKGAVPEFGPFVVGGCVIAAGYAFGALSGGFFNPAIVLGNAVGSKFQVIYTFSPLMYVCGQLLGGLLAGAVFRFFTHKEEFPAPLSEDDKQVKLLPVLA
jgi:aquaporin Z